MELVNHWHRTLLVGRTENRVNGFANRAAIVGIGQTEFSKNSGRSPLQLAAEASLAALDDAGLSARDVDGMILFTVEDNEEGDVMKTLGIPGLSWSARVGLGGGGSAGAVFQAAAAIASGAAETVLILRAFNERSESRFGQASKKSLSSYGWNGTAFNYLVWSLPYGVMTPAAMIAMANLPYMRQYGVTNEDFAHYVVTAREHAATNPAAWYYERPITIADHQASKWIVEPVIRLLDCCQESDGGAALVMTNADRARGLRQKPAIVRGGAWDVRPSGTMGLAAREELVAERLWRSSGLGPHNISLAMLYDAFTPEVFTQTESFGFCKPGEAKDFYRCGEGRLGGAMPINPNGGLIGEAYIHGMNQITEAVRQIRGTAANQVARVENVLVSSGSSAHIIGTL
jgi:acetyl-CoA acetyltransferase